METERFYLIELNSYQFFPTAVDGVDFKRWQLVSTLEEKLKAKGKKNAFNKPS